jgi:hypothetical protein
MLQYRLLKKLFPDTHGIQDQDLQFEYVFINPFQTVKKGLFIPFCEENEALKEAINHGAIGAIWHKEKLLPRYTPNHFPVFFVQDVKEAFLLLIDEYCLKIKNEGIRDENMTKFLISERFAHKEKNFSYDNAVAECLRKAKAKLEGLFLEGRGE